MSPSTETAHLLQAVYGDGSQLSDVAASAPLPDVLTGILQTSNGDVTTAIGSSQSDQSEVMTWIGKAGQETSLQTPDQLTALNDHLITRTYLVANRKTAADIAVLGATHAWLAKASHEERLQLPEVTRFLDLLQHDPDVVKTGLLSIVPVDVDRVPKKERRKPVPAAKTKGEKATPSIANGAPTTKKDKKEKKGNVGATDASTTSAGAGGAGGASGSGSPSVPDSGPHPSNVDLRVGRIIEIAKHPDAEKLYVEKIDLGESEPRTVVSGLVDYIPIDQLQDRLLIAVCNLKPANMRGVKSFAMVLAATAKEGKGPGSVELVEVPEGSQPGDRVFFEGHENDLPLEQLNPKKKIWEAVAPGLCTLETREAAWRDPTDRTKVLRIVTKRGRCLGPFAEATLS